MAEDIFSLSEWGLKIAALRSNGLYAPIRWVSSSVSGYFRIDLDDPGLGFFQMGMSEQGAAKLDTYIQM